MELRPAITGQETKGVNNQWLHLNQNMLPVRPKAHSQFPTFQALKVFFFFPIRHVQVRKIKYTLKFICGYYLRIKEKPHFLGNHGMPSLGKRRQQNQ